MQQPEEEDPLQCKLDSHADTCCGGANCLFIKFEGCMVMVAPYHNEYEPMTVKIAMVATLWEDPKDGQLYILLIHEALYFGDHLQQTLLNPNQLRSHGLIVEEHLDSLTQSHCTRFICHKMVSSYHSTWMV